MLKTYELFTSASTARCFFAAVRCKHKENHWSMQRKKKTATTKALEHFDEFYDDVYKRRWPALRRALLGKQKYVAIVNNYSDTEETMRLLEEKGAINVRTLYNLERERIAEQRLNDTKERRLQKIWSQAGENQQSSKQIHIEDIEQPDMQQPIETGPSLAASLTHAHLDHSRIIAADQPNDILYDFVPATRMKGRDDFEPEVRYDTHVAPNRLHPHDVQPIVEYELHFPDHLQVYCFEAENHDSFPHPRRGTTGVLNYYLLDGGSILPVLALDLRAGHRVLDMCAAPGGKSLIALQTLYPHHLQSNDVSASRANRVRGVMGEYLYDFDEKWVRSGRVNISQCDARHLPDTGGFDRVLVDVPCTTDRHSLKEDDNNIFRADRIKERLRLPELQTELLVNALRLVRAGGVVVYSTCSLSPIQNEGVVGMALRQLRDDDSIAVDVIDLRPALARFRHVYEFSSAETTRYGHLVMPATHQNYGPTYFCKLQRRL